ncbi:MAG: tetratricopeptide repeat protein [Bacteroidales bacterium]
MLKPKISHILILVAISFLIYSNSLDCSWQFDDYQNIVNQDSLHLTDFNLSSIKQTFFSKDAGQLYRPVACLTFALNYYFGGLNVSGYHLVNIFIHILTAIFLYLVMLQILSINKQNNGWHFKYKYEIALLASVLWAASPINVQAVTYIVQRMASLAALFSIISIYFYFRFRFQKKWRYFIFCIIAFALGFLSKENAALLPFSILLIELVFFRGISIKTWIKTIPVFIFCSLIVLVIAIGFFDFNFTQLLRYETRLFTPYQRILTEFRILVYYLYQIIYPNVSNLSIHHDIVISRSLFSPLSTFFSIVFVVSLVGSALALLKKYPLYSFAVLFYFLNHAVESSFIGLELMFEHRNYLPSFFLFLPLSYAAFYLMDRYKSKSYVVYYGLPVFILFVVIGFGMATYTRNFDWKTEKTLWEDAAQKAPKSSRPLHNLAWSYYERIGNTDKALLLYKKALSLKFYDVFQKASLIHNVAFIYHQRGDKDQALKYMEKAVNSSPRFIKMKRRLAYMLISYKEYRAAGKIIEKLLAENPSDVGSIFLYGKNLYLTGEYEKAVKELEKILQSKKDPGVISYLSRSYLKLGLYDKSGLILSISDTDSLTHHLLGILTAYYQNDSQTLNSLVEVLYKSKSAFFMEKIHQNEIYQDLNQDFNNILENIFEQEHKKQVQELRSLA